MLDSTSSSNIDLFQDILSQVYYRRLLLHTPLYQVTETAPTASSQNASFGTRPGDNNFDANVVMVLSVLLCALICSLGLNSIVRCALRCSSLVPSSESETNPLGRLANTGIKKKALKTFPIVNYNERLKLPGLDSECAICLSEFAPNEKVKVLPKCRHGFHIRCIDKWLNSHSSCPTCRNCLIETCQKIVGYQGSSSAPATSGAETIVSIPPLEPEGLICNYRTNIR